MVKSINDTANRSLRGRAPTSVNPENVEEVRLDAYLARNPPKRPSSVFKKDFQRDYDQTYIEEIFIVSARFMSQGIPIYKLKDMLDNPILGTFYASQIHTVNKNEETIWRIDKILRKRKKDDKNEVLVRWLGWPKKFDSWVLEKDIKKTWFDVILSFVNTMSIRMVLKSSDSIAVHGDNKSAIT